jgi:hypothetical protein
MPAEFWADCSNVSGLPLDMELPAYHLALPEGSLSRKASAESVEILRATHNGVVKVLSSFKKLKLRNRIGNGSRLPIMTCFTSQEPSSGNHNQFSITLI